MKENLADQAQRSEMLARLRRMTPESARRWGRMTPHQAICHLSDSFRSMMGPTPPSSVATPWSKTVIKWLALSAPMKWPHGVPTRPEVDQMIGGTRPVEFARDRQQLEALMEQFVARNADGLQPHPMFGRMSAEEWRRWAWRHMDHHLRQFGV